MATATLVTGSGGPATNIPVTTQSGTTYTFALVDAGTQVESTSSSATTFTIPTNASVAFPVGSVIYAYQSGAGALTVAAAGGVTLNVPTNGVTTLAQFGSLMLVKIATNTWTSICFGPANPLNWRGMYSTTTLYNINDVVLYEGTLWVCGTQNGPGFLTYPVLTGTATADGNGTGGTVTVPSTALVGDVILLALTTIGSTALPSAPTGYTLSYSINATGGTFGCNLGIYTKTAVLGDIGTNVTIPSLTNLWSVILRTYTSNGLDTGGSSHATSSAASSTLAPAAVSSTLGPLERAVYFFASFLNNSATTPSFSASNSTNQFLFQNPLATSYQIMGTEDCQIPSLGASPITGGTFNTGTSGGGSPTTAQCALCLQEGPSVGVWMPSNWTNLDQGLPSTQQSTTAYTFALTDAGTVVESTSSSATTFTVPPNSSVAYPVGTVLYAYQYGTGTLTLAAGAGVTLLNNQSGISQYGMVQLRQRAANVWAVASFGDPTTIALSSQSGTTYTFGLTDAGTQVQSTSSSATTFTIPTNATTAFPIGTMLEAYQSGTGALTIAAAGGVTLNVPTNGVSVLTQYQTIILVKTATNTWASINSGPANPLNWRGNWSGANAYAVNDVVLYEGALQVCNTAQAAGAAVNATLSGTSFATGGSTVSVPIPTGTKVGDLMLLGVSEYGNTTPSTPTGWAAVSGGHALGTANPTYPVAMTVYSKTAVSGDLGGSVSVATGSGNVSAFQIRSYTCSTGVDGSAVSAPGTTSLAALTATAAATYETMVVFYGVIAASGTNQAIALGSGAGNVLSTNTGSNSVLGVSADFQATPAGAFTPANAAATPSGSGVSAVEVGVMISSTPGTPPFYQPAWTNLDQGLPQTQQSSTSYTFALTDAGTQVQSTSGSATTFTIPTNAVTAFPVGSVLYAYQLGAGPLSVAPAAGVTLNIPTNGVLTLSQYQSMMLVKTATNTWTSICFGPANPLNYRGAWSSSGNYLVNDVVLYEGGLYACAIANGASSLAFPLLTGAATNFTTGAATTTQITVPGTVQVGDLMMVTIYSFDTPITPTGWTATNTGSNNGSWRVYTKTAVLGDIGTTIAFTSGTGTYDGPIIFRSYTCGGLDGSVAVSNTVARTATAPAMTAGFATEAYVFFYLLQVSSSGLTAPTFSAGNNQQYLVEPTFTQKMGAACDFTVASAGSFTPGCTITANGGSGTNQGGVFVSALLKGYLPTLFNPTQWVHLDQGLPSTQQSGTTYTFALTDAGTVVESTSSSATTFTVPPNSSVAFPVGTVLYAFQQGTGALSLAAGAGVTLLNNQTNVGQNGMVQLRQRTANAWAVEAFGAPGGSWVTKSANYTLLATDGGVTVTATATITLPAGPSPSRRYGVKNFGAGITVTVSTGGANVIDSGGGVNATSLTITTQGQSIDFAVAPNGTDWIIV